MSPKNVRTSPDSCALYSFDFVSINEPESRLPVHGTIGTSISKIMLPTRKSPLCGVNPNISSNNGVVCIYNPQRNIILINPSTRRYQQLPPFPIDKFRTSAYGFGFDKVRSDFKFILHVRLGRSLKLVVLVYELKSNLWRTMESALDNPKVFFKTDYGACCGLFVSGLLHWIVGVEDKMSFGNWVWGPNVEVIGGFDLATEEYRLMGLPECSKIWGAYTMDVLERCLCHSYCNGEKCTNVDILVMKEYGVVEFWTRLYVIELPDIKFPHNGFPLVRPRVLSDYGDHRRVLLEVNGGLLWYDVVNKSIEHIILWDKHELLESYQKAIANSESLVHLKDPLERGRPATTTTIPNANRILPTTRSKRKIRE